MTLMPSLHSQLCRLYTSEQKVWHSVPWHPPTVVHCYCLGICGIFPLTFNLCPGVHRLPSARKMRDKMEWHLTMSSLWSSQQSQTTGKVLVSATEPIPQLTYILHSDSDDRPNCHITNYCWSISSLVGHDSLQQWDSKVFLGGPALSWQTFWYPKNRQSQEDGYWSQFRDYSMAE